MNWGAGRATRHPLARSVVNVTDTTTDANQPVLGIVTQIVARRLVVAQIAGGIVERVAVWRVAGNMVVGVKHLQTKTM